MKIATDETMKVGRIAFAAEQSAVGYADSAEAAAKAAAAFSRIAARAAANARTAAGQ